MIFQASGRGPKTKIFKYTQNFNTPGTWKYHPDVPMPAGIKYAMVYAKGQDIESLCPQSLSNRWSALSDRLAAYHNATHQARICLKRNDFFSLLPNDFTAEFMELKNKITEHILKNYKEPKNYDFLARTHEMLEEISYNEIKIDSSVLSCKGIAEPNLKNNIRSLKNKGNRILYDQFKSKTGRLTTRRGSFPILNLKKELRSCIIPNNDLFVEYDFNAAEIRTLLALGGKTQPEEDIHEWNIHNIFKEEMTRGESKKRLFSWLYNSNSKDSVLDGFYDRDGILSKFWDGSMIRTDFEREIPSDNFRALNYLLQSTTNDLVLENALKMNNKLRSKKSFIAFTLHDSVVLDFSKEDTHLLGELTTAFSETRYGKFKTIISMGKSFGEMREIQ